MTGPLRVGVIGAGGRGTSVADDFDDHPDMGITALADISEETRDTAGDRLDVGTDSQYEAYEDILARESLDAVIVATPHTLHYEQVLAAFDAGLDVFCEKPLTTDLDRATDLARHAESGENVLMVGYKYHVDPIYRVGRERWAEGDHVPSLITAEVMQDWIGGAATGWRTDPELSGGGMLYDTGNHLVDAILWMTDLTPTHVTAAMTWHDPARRVDLRSALTIEFAEGAVASLGIDGTHVRGRTNAVHIGDDGGRLRVSDGVNEEGTAILVDADGTRTTPDPATTPGSQADAFAAAVLEGAAPPATAGDALRATAVTEACYEAARSGEQTAVDVPDPPAD